MEPALLAFFGEVSVLRRGLLSLWRPNLTSCLPLCHVVWMPQHRSRSRTAVLGESWTWSSATGHSVLLCVCSSSSSASSNASQGSALHISTAALIQLIKQKAMFIVRQSSCINAWGGRNPFWMECEHSNRDIVLNWAVLLLLLEGRRMVENMSNFSVP